jgi:NTP pyrophosphatase (non-canonical NTP hydrolase)
MTEKPFPQNAAQMTAGVVKIDNAKISDGVVDDAPFFPPMGTQKDDIWTDGAPPPSTVGELLPGAVTRYAGRHLQHVCHEAANKAGWWRHAKTGKDLARMVKAPEGPHEELTGGALVAQKLCLIHSEISEAMEGHRKGLMDDKLPHRTMLEVELADAVIRICDLAGAMDLDLGAAIAQKLAYNATRADHKPEARAASGGKAY